MGGTEEAKPRISRYASTVSADRMRCRLPSTAAIILDSSRFPPSKAFLTAGYGTLGYAPQPEANGWHPFVMVHTATPIGVEAISRWLSEAIPPDT